jgi:hypothetical protein
MSPDNRRGGAPQQLTLSWVGEDSLEAQFPLQNAGMYLGAVRLGTGAVLPLAPLSLPYSPEFEPRSDPHEGRNTLREIAHITGGIERTTWDDVFNSTQLRNRQVRDLVMPLTLMLLVLHVAEIGGRRLLLFDALRTAARAWLRTIRFPRIRRASSRPTVASPDPAAATSGETPDVVAPRPAASSLARAKARARDRMGR